MAELESAPEPHPVSSHPKTSALDFALCVLRALPAPKTVRDRDAAHPFEITAQFAFQKRFYSLALHPVHVRNLTLWNHLSQFTRPNPFDTHFVFEEVVHGIKRSAASKTVGIAELVCFDDIVKPGQFAARKEYIPFDTLYDALLNLQRGIVNSGGGKRLYVTHAEAPPVGQRFRLQHDRNRLACGFLKMVFELFCRKLFAHGRLFGQNDRNIAVHDLRSHWSRSLAASGKNERQNKRTYQKQ